MGVLSRRKAARQSLAAPTAARRSVSILIAARDYARFLPEAIESALSQTIPCEVIYSDDASRDESVQVARGFESRGLIVLTTSRHIGACAARNRAVAASSGEFLVHLDGDDVLPRDFVEKHLSAMQPGVPFVYGPAQAFGLFETLWKVPGWEEFDQWKQNTVNTSAMYAQWAFDRVGGWRDGPGSMWDWDLAIRASRLGTPRASEATLKYRQHDGSWSREAERAEGYRGFAKYQQAVRRANATLSIVAVLSGRLPGLFPEWAGRIREALKWVHLPQPAEFILLDNSRSAEFGEMIRDEFHGENARVLPHPDRFEWITERQRRDRVAEFMAHACNRLVSLARGDLIWMIEDDVLVPAAAAAKLRSTLTGGDAPHAATGLYRSRHGTGKIVAGWRAADRWMEMVDVPRQATPVDISGTGCLMFWRDRPAIPKQFKSHVIGVPAHDWAWGMDLKANGGVLLADSDVRCEHVDTMENRIRV